MSEQEVVVAPEELDATSESLPGTESSEQETSGSHRSIADLDPGMELQGTVKSVTDFGAFVDLGVGPQGLVHISQLARRRVEKVGDVVKVGDEVTVWIKKVDKKRGRISLTMVKPPTVHLKDLKADTVVPGVVTRIEPYGVFIDIGTGRDGMVHVSELTEGYVSSPSEVLSVGDKIEVKVINVDRKARKVDLSTKEFIEPPRSAGPPKSKAVKDEPAEQEAPIPTVMELAFQAALEKSNDRKKQSNIDKLVSKTAK